MKYIHFLLLATCLMVPKNGFTQVGSLDLSFSDDGILNSNFGMEHSDATCISLQPDAKILFGGSAWTMINVNFAVGRLLPDGTYDNSFSGDGINNIDLGSEVEALRLTTLAVRPNGKIICLGDARVNGLPSFVLVQLENDGMVDSAFGLNGVAKTNFTQYDSPSSMEIQTDGKIIVAGYSASFLENILILARYQENGQLDQSFNNIGYRKDFNVTNAARINDIGLQADGKIIVAGVGRPDNNMQHSDYMLRRYDTNGQLDPTFGDAGMVLGDLLGQQNTWINRIDIQADGKIVAIGTTSSPFKGFIARFLPNGELDMSFGVNGSLNLNPTEGDADPRDVYVLPDGKILVAGRSIPDYSTGEFVVYLARFMENGMPDSTFGVGGVQNTLLGPGNVAVAIAVQPDGKILLTGDSGIASFVSRHLTELHVGLLDFTAEAVVPLIYPNPIVETATLQYELSEATAITVELYDLQGKRMLTLLPETEQAEGKHEVPVVLPSHLASGAYVVSVSNGKGRVAVQVMKQ